MFHNSVQVSVYALITFFMIGFETTFAKFAQYWLILLLTLNLFTVYGAPLPALPPPLPTCTPSCEAASCT